MSLQLLCIHIGSYVSGVIMPQLGLAARALADSSSRHLIDFPRQNALKKNPESISPIYLSLPRTPSISIHFPSCCANDVWLSQSIKEDIKLYSIISPLSLRTCAFPSSVANSSKREGFRPRFRLISQGAHQSSRLTLRPVVLFQTVVQLFQEKGQQWPQRLCKERANTSALCLILPLHSVCPNHWHDWSQGFTIITDNQSQDPLLWPGSSPFLRSQCY